MKKKRISIIAIWVMGLSLNLWAMNHSTGDSASGAGNHSQGHAETHSSDHDMKSSAGHHMDDHSHRTGDGTFTHQAMVDGMHSEFQVMSLASMNMKDPAGNTHHIMVKMTHGETGESMPGARGRIKVIAPSGAEQISDLKDYGGMMAANFTFMEKGNHGVICLIKVGDKKRVFKFWYPH